MNKETLKTAASGFTAGQEITVNFVGGSYQGFGSGQFRVVGVKVGRGKGGSKLIDLVSLRDGRALTIGTPVSDAILNVVAGGTMLGDESESAMGAGTARDAANAAVLKEAFGTFSAGSRIRLHSSVADLDGIFTVLGSRTLPGRGGQRELSLESATGTPLTVWSYRHSAMITSVETL